MWQEGRSVFSGQDSRGFEVGVYLGCLINSGNEFGRQMKLDYIGFYYFGNLVFLCMGWEVSGEF